MQDFEKGCKGSFSTEVDRPVGIIPGSVASPPLTHHFEGKNRPLVVQFMQIGLDLTKRDLLANLIRPMPPYPV